METKLFESQYQNKLNFSVNIYLISLIVWTIWLTVFMYEVELGRGTIWYVKD